MRRFLLLSLLALVCLAAGASAAGGDRERPYRVEVSAHGLFVRASQGTYCVVGERSSVCADYAYPLKVRGRLPVEPGRRIRLHMHDAGIERLSVGLLRVDGSRIRGRGRLRDVRRVPGQRRMWRGTIPNDATDANRLDINAKYRRNRGGSNWWAGLRVE